MPREPKFLSPDQTLPSTPARPIHSTSTGNGTHAPALAHTHHHQSKSPAGMCYHLLIKQGRWPVLSLTLSFSLFSHQPSNPVNSLSSHSQVCLLFSNPSTLSLVYVFFTLTLNNAPAFELITCSGCRPCILQCAVAR
jgi:hypothetical protein